MKIYPDAGKLDERLELLALTRKGERYEWQGIRRPWAHVEPSTRQNVWSVKGIGAKGAQILIRKQPITPDHALRWRGQHGLITSISQYDFNHLLVEVALVVLHDCVDDTSGTAFPAVMTEEYHRHSQEEPMALNVIRHVLVTPKAIELIPGNLVTVDGKIWHVLTAHLLEPRQNEYIIERVVDL